MKQAVCASFKLEIIQGVHKATDVYKIALYGEGSDKGQDTTHYDTKDEVSGLGYTAGGRMLTGYAAGQSDGVAWLSFADVTWPNSSITARGALIYNSTVDNRAVVVLDFFENKKSLAGAFVVLFPTADKNQATIRIN